MKRSVVWFLVVMLTVVGLVLAACAQPAPTPAPKPSPAPAPSPKPTAAPSPSPTAKPAYDEGKLKDYVIFTNRQGGTVYIVAGAFANILQKYGPFKSAVEVDISILNFMDRWEKGTGDAFVWSPPQVLPAYYGTKPMPKAYRAWRLFSAGGLSQTLINIIASAKSGIKSGADLRGKRFISEAAEPTWAAEVGDGILKANGMTRKDVKWLPFASSADAEKEIIEGRADAWTYVWGLSTQNVEKAVGLSPINLTDKEIAAIREIQPGFSKAIIPKGYGSSPADLVGVGAPHQYWVRSDLSIVTAYQMVKVLFEHLKEFQAVHEAGTGVTLQNVFTWFGTPIHPGAVKYFKEVGVWKAEHDKIQRDLLLDEAKRFKTPTPHEDYFKAVGILP